MSGKSFLDLPLPVRCRIYSFTGLLRYCPIDLNHEGPHLREQYVNLCMRGYADDVDTFRARQGYSCCFYQRRRQNQFPPSPGPDGIDCMCPSIPWHLFLVCRSLHAEVKTLFYSENQFKISRSDSGGLKRLLKLDKSALSRMTSLHIRLNACGCLPGPPCLQRLPYRIPTPFCSYCHIGCKCGPDLPLASTDPGSSAAVVQEWQQVARHLAANITPGRLRLGLVCDTVDLDIARQITAPLQQQEWPLLADCAIRLGQKPNHDLQALAQSVVQQVTGQAMTTHMTFPWSNLPDELQLQILHHSALVSPKPLTWTSGRFPFGRQSCCQKCTPTLESCHCSPLHAAYTSSLKCTCWRWPGEFFRVSKTFRKQALQIAYGYNEFVIPTPDSTQDDDSPGYLSVYKFLTAIPPEALPHIRLLRIHTEYCQNVIHHHRMESSLLLFQEQQQDDHWDQWDQGLKYISQHLNLSKLNLVITIDRELQAFYALERKQEDDLKFWEFCQRVVRSLAVLKENHSHNQNQNQNQIMKCTKNNKKGSYKKGKKTTKQIGRVAICFPPNQAQGQGQGQTMLSQSRERQLQSILAAILQQDQV